MNKTQDQNRDQKQSLLKGSGKVLKRLLKLLFSFYPVMLPFTIGCIIVNAIISTLPAVFQQRVIALIEQNWQSGNWSAVSGEIMGLVGLLAVLYVISLIAGFTYNRLMAIITQGSLMKLRKRMFNGMEDLPIGYFDTHNHGDIMSYYTNDIDTLRQLISMSIPQLMISGIMVFSILLIMLYYSFWLTAVVLCGVFVMSKVTKRSAAVPAGIS